MNWLIIGLMTIFPQFWWIIWYYASKCSCEMKIKQKLFSIGVVSLIYQIFLFLFVIYMEDIKMLPTLIFSSLLFCLVEMGYLVYFLYKTEAQKCKCNTFSYVGSVATLGVFTIMIGWFIYCLFAVK